MRRSSFRIKPVGESTDSRRSRIYPALPMVGVGAVIKRRNEVLLIKRRFEPNKGKWSFPGGLVEVGETVRDAVVREAEEETGLKVRVERLIDVLDDVILDSKGRIRYHFVLVDFLVRSIGGSFRLNKEIENSAWVTKRSAENYDVTKLVRTVLKRIL